MFMTLHLRTVTSPVLDWAGTIREWRLSTFSCYTVSNKEYCYCVISTDSNESGLIVIEPESADYQFNRKIYLGETKMEPKKFI